MYDLVPSRTALRVAMRRAAHQLIDRPLVFEDPLALSILGPETAARLQAAIAQDEARGSAGLRAFLAVRSRYAEDQLAGAVGRGVDQYVVLGAGLDTFAYRNPHDGLRVFEVDHSSTQAWKREQLAAAGIAIPDGTTFVPVDFEKESLPARLQAAGFLHDDPAFFSWLGVVPYLTELAFTATISWIAGLPEPTAVVFDYAVSRASLSEEHRRAAEAMAERVARAGEPFQLFFEPVQLAAVLDGHGFRRTEDLGPDELNARYFEDRTDGLAIRGGRIACARR